jgi:hypothetical protein
VHIQSRGIISGIWEFAPEPPVQADILRIFQLLLRMWRIQNATLMKAKQYDVLLSGRKVT